MAKEDVIEVLGVVDEALPNAMFKVKHQDSSGRQSNNGDLAIRSFPRQNHLERR